MKKYTVIVIIGLVLWIGETWYFGWNEHAESPVERILDTVSWLLVIWGVVADILTNVTIHKETNVTADKVEIINNAYPQPDEKGEG